MIYPCDDVSSSLLIYPCWIAHQALQYHFWVLSEWQIHFYYLWRFCRDIVCWDSSFLVACIRHHHSSVVISLLSYSEPQSRRSWRFASADFLCWRQVLQGPPRLRLRQHRLRYHRYLLMINGRQMIWVWTGCFHFITCNCDNGERSAPARISAIPQLWSTFWIHHLSSSNPELSSGTTSEQRIAWSWSNMKIELVSEERPAASCPTFFAGDSGAPLLFLVEYNFSCLWLGWLHSTQWAETASLEIASHAATLYGELVHPQNDIRSTNWSWSSKMGYSWRAWTYSSSN